MRRGWIYLAMLTSTLACHAQQTTTTPAVNTTVVVLGQVIPVAQEESARSVVIHDAQADPLAYHQLEDYLRTDASVDIQQRGGAGIMSDLSIRGASFGQTLVLLNGFRFDNSETAHFNMDVPVPMLAIGHLDVLHGEGSTLYGADAIGGVVDLRTVKPEENALRIKSGFGSFGENEQAAAASVARKSWSDILAGDREFSTGFMPDRDYRSENGFNEFRLQSALGHSDLMLAGDSRSYGADQFYGPYNSWEKTKGWFAALTQQFNTNTQASAAYRRHSDIYLLRRNQPTGYKNQHIDDGFEGAIRDQRQIAKHITLATGVEEDTDQINSTKLGRHGRNRSAVYATAEWFASSRGSVSFGAREEVFGGGSAVFSPMLAASRQLTSTVTMHAALGHGFRAPSYLDLYYSDPTTIGNAGLKPESGWNYEGGLNWTPKPQLAASITGFCSQQHDTIDYVRESPAAKWRATNLPGVRFAGVESSLAWQPTSSERLSISWTYLNGAQNALHGLQSKYVFNYPVNNARLTWSQQIQRQISLNTRMAVAQRWRQSPYFVWDLSLTRTVGRIRPYLQMANLVNTGYAETVGVRMPGRAFVGGVEILLTKLAK